MKGAFSSLRQILTTESPLKIMKNAFYFTLKFIFVLKTFKFLSSFSVHVENGLIKKIRLTLKLMTSQPKEQTTAMHICLRSQEVKAVRR